MRNLSLAVLLLFHSSGIAANQLQDYAYQAELNPADQALQRVELPLNIILQVTQSDLGDVAVFNRDGKPVPYAITRAQDKTLDHQRNLPFHEFSQFQRQNSKTVTTREQNQQDGSELETTQTVPVQSERKVYLIELADEADAARFDRVELNWRHEPANQMLRLKVEVGNDLDSMRVIKGNTTLTNQQSDDLSWRSIAGIPRQQKYLRLTPDDSVSQFELHRVTGFWQEKQAAPQLSYRIKTELTRHDEGEFYHFTMPSQVHPRSLRIIPADSHSIVSGDLYASHSDFDKRYRLRSGFRQHNIEGDEVKPSEPIKLRRQRLDDLWIKLSHDVSSPPRVELNYAQYELIFLGDGQEPYFLAWGNHEAGGKQDRLTAVLQDSLAEAQRRGSLVTLRQPEDAGGKGRLAPEPKLPWKKWTLWALLILAAIIAMRMAIGLYREMNRSGETI